MVAKDIFPVATVTDSGKEVNFMGFSYEFGILDLFKRFTRNVDFIEQFQKIYPFPTVNQWC